MARRVLCPPGPVEVQFAPDASEIAVEKPATSTLFMRSFPAACLSRMIMAALSAHLNVPEDPVSATAIVI
jgi:hypothetical protein